MSILASFQNSFKGFSLKLKNIKTSQEIRHAIFFPKDKDTLQKQELTIIFHMLKNMQCFLLNFNLHADWESFRQQWRNQF